MELVVRKTDLLRELQLFQGIVERKNTIPILANVLIEADGDERDAARDRSRGRAAQPLRGDGHQARLADAAGEEAVRDRQGAARDRRPDRGRQERREGRGRALRVADADAAARGLSDAAGRDRRRSARRCRATSLQADDREDAVRDHRRGHALFPERRAVRPAARLDDLVATDGHRLALVTVPRASRRRKATPTKSRSSCRARRCSSSAGCSPTATATSSTSAARTTCSSRSAAGC